MWPSGKLAAKTPERQAHNAQVLVFQLLWFGLWEVAWLYFPSSLPAFLGLNQIFAWCHRGRSRGGASRAGSQIPLPNTRVCTSLTSSLILWKRKPTKINIDISRVMKQLQSWFTTVSLHFMACLHLQRGEQAGDAGVGRRLLWIIFRAAHWSISFPRRSLGGLTSEDIQASEMRWIAPNPKENHVIKWSSSIT